MKYKRVEDKGELLFDDLVELILDKDFLVLNIVADESSVRDNAALDELFGCAGSPWLHTDFL